VRSSNLEVVAHDGDRLDEVLKKREAGLASLAGRDLDADAELGDRDGGNGRFVVVGYQGVEIGTESFGVDECARVEE
jgi:hypothetical protein